MSWLSHSRVLRFISLEIEYENLTPLRIGSGKAKTPTSPIDLQVLTINIGAEIDVPYIPGSSLKGVFRSSAERILASKKISICYMGEGCKANYDKDLQTMIRNGASEDDIVELLQEYCNVCKLFGTATYSSHIQFDDAYPRLDSIPARSVKTGIAIERRSGAVKGGALYQVEFVNPGSKFYGKINLINTPNYGIGLIAEILEQINAGYTRIGGFKTRGFGLIKCNVLDINGLSLVDGKLVNIKELEKLAPLDGDDVELKLEPTKPMNILAASKLALENFINKSKK